MNYLNPFPQTQTFFYQIKSLNIPLEYTLGNANLH